MKDLMNKENLEEYFAFLDVVRESGVTNMYGAGSYLQEQFDLKRGDSHKVLGAWMKTFGDGSETPAERAAKAETIGE